MSKGTILIIEDSASFRKIYGDRLVFEGFDVIEASDGEEGIKLAAEKPIDLIITDIKMPGVDGYQVIETLKKDEKLKSIPILVMSIFDTPEHFKKVRDLGAEAWVMKGTQTPNDIAKKVKEMIGEKE